MCQLTERRTIFCPWSPDQSGRVPSDDSSLIRTSVTWDESPILRASFTPGHHSIDQTPRRPHSEVPGVGAPTCGHWSSLNNHLVAKSPSVASSPCCGCTHKPALIWRRGVGAGDAYWRRVADFRRVGTEGLGVAAEEAGVCGFWTGALHVTRHALRR